MSDRKLTDSQVVEIRKRGLTESFHVIAADYGVSPSCISDAVRGVTYANVPGALGRVDMRQKHGADYFSRLGKVGGSNGHTGGFYKDRELAVWAGRLGGSKSRRRDGKGRP